MEYQSVEQLLKDDGFLAWYKGTDRDEIARWTSWIIDSEENGELARQAYDLLQAMEEVEGKAITEEEIAEIWAAIEAGIRQDERTIPDT
jgi:hypothetical protein